MVNVKRILNQNARLRTQWISPTHRAADIGQTCDHILATKNLINTTRNSNEEADLILQITTFMIKQKMGGHKGQSDHCPIDIELSWVRPHLNGCIPVESAHSGQHSPSVLVAQIKAQRPEVRKQTSSSLADQSSKFK